MSEDLDTSPELDGEAPRHHDEQFATPPAVQQAALVELERRHRVVAEEYARLTAILEAAGRHPSELEMTSDVRGLPAYGYNGEGALTAWDRGSVMRGGVWPPEPQRVVHLGTERHQSAAVTRRRNLAVGLSAAAVGAVVAAALMVLLIQPRSASTEAPVAQAPASEEVATVQSLDPVDPSGQTAAPPAAPQAAPPSSPAIDAVIAQASTVPNLAPNVDDLVRRLPAFTSLTGLPRQEEAADIYGLAVTEARTDTSGVAEAMVSALEPEVTYEGVLSLAVNRPGVAGPGFTPLVGDMQALPTLPAERQRQAAQELIDAVAVGVAEDTIGGPFCNSIMYVLMPYGITPPS